jgi:hypothetical protein
VDQEHLLINLLATGLAHCRAVTIEHGGLFSSLFVAGLFGGATHCVGMCGPFVLAQTVARLEARPATEMREIHRLAGAALIPYHLGRSTTYAGLGAAGAFVAAGIVDFTGLKWLSAALLALAAIFFLGYAAQRLGVYLPWLSSGGEGWWSRHIGRLARPLFDRPVGFRGYALGLALGFLPCGLLYGAVAAAASSGGAISGAMAMIAFSVGTIPALLAVGLAGHVAGRRWQGAVAKVTPVLMMVNAVALSYLAWRSIA